MKGKRKASKEMKIRLTDQQHQLFKILSNRTGSSMTEIARQYVLKGLEEDHKKLGGENFGDLSENTDPSSKVEGKDN